MDGRRNDDATVFPTRREAGRRLGARLAHLRRDKPVVLGLPRGGVPVAYEVARALAAPLDVVVVRKLGVPFQPEVAMGAIGEGGVRLLDLHTVRACHLGVDEVAAVERRESAELEHRVRRLREGRPGVPLRGRTCIVVDDGMATGATARTACRVVRARGAASVLLAVPVAPAATLPAARADADEVVCLETPADFSAVGAWYRDFSQVTESEVVALLDAAATSPLVPAARLDRWAADDPEAVAVPAGGVVLPGHLSVPADRRGVVLFADGSGSSRHSTRSRSLAAVLAAAGFATLLFDLLSDREELDRANVFDVDLLAGRLVDATRWVITRQGLDGAPVGYIGGSTGAPAVFTAAARLEDVVAAVVSCGGRPDLAADALTKVRAPTLLIVGGRDRAVLARNRWAAQRLTCEHQLAVVPGAGHLFEEAGALEAAAALARDWLLDHLVGAAAAG